MQGRAANRHLAISKRRGNHKRVVRLQPNSDAVDVSANRIQKKTSCRKKLLLEPDQPSTNLGINEPDSHPNNQEEDDLQHPQS
jgi:hypothetical protein